MYSFIFLTTHRFRFHRTIIHSTSTKSNPRFRRTILHSTRINSNTRISNVHFFTSHEFASATAIRLSQSLQLYLLNSVQGLPSKQEQPSILSSGQPSGVRVGTSMVPIR